MNNFEGGWISWIQMEVTDTLVPIRAMTGLCANGDIRPKNWFQKVSLFGPLYLSQKWWRSCKEAKHMYL
jgi:hypothetical protein